MCSDVFIFENSTECESYVLVILAEDDVSKEEFYQSFSLEVFSFIKIDLKEIVPKAVTKSERIEG